MNLREAAEQALEALGSARSVFNGEHDTCGGCAWCDAPAYGPCEPHCDKEKAVAALRAALAENQSEDALGMVEPVAYIHETGFLVRNPAATLTAGMKLYTAPPKREPLTEAELEPIRRRMMMEAYNAADDGDSERYNALKVMANDVLDMLLGGEK